MEGKRESFKYTSTVGIKLILLSIAMFILNVLVLFQINNNIFNSQWYSIPVSVIIVLIPFISYNLFYWANQLRDDYRDKLTYCKYRPIFPFYFYLDKRKKKGKRINLENITKLLKPGDIILRRFNNYLDGLIFSQNSYFTHVGIFYIDPHNNHLVLHSEGKNGVHKTSLEEFLNCDDTAILRFSFDKNHDQFNIRQHILNADKTFYESPNLKQNELIVFEKLVETISPKERQTAQKSDYDYEEKYSKIVLERALSLLGTPYDFKFDFNNFESLSCIEYVWYCFKCLYPIHQIKIKDFEFFNIITLPIIIPDVFIKNKHFRYIYSSLPSIHSKKELKKHIKKGIHQLRWFLLSIFIWDLIITGILFIIFYHHLS